MSNANPGRPPTDTLEEDAYVELQRAADALSRTLSERLKVEDLSAAQYNVLRILRAAGPEGLPCGAIADRMVTRDPDVTRLLDRLERRGLVARVREARDRRVVRTTITAMALGLLSRLDAPIAALHEEQLAHLGHVRLRALIQLLTLARQRAQAPAAAPQPESLP
jgi:DNA-binding MarR family transcriptional regulator